MLLRRYHKYTEEVKDDVVEEIIIEEEKSIKSLKVEELKDLAKEKGIKGYNKMNKTELITALAGD